MRIVHVAGSIDPDYGSWPAAVVEALARMQVELGHSVTILAPAPRREAGTTEEGGVTVRRFPSSALTSGWRGADPSAWGIVRALLRDRTAQIVHLHGTGRCSTLAAWACARRGLPYAVTLDATLAEQQARREALSESRWRWVPRLSPLERLTRSRNLVHGAMALFVVEPADVEPVRAVYPEQIVAPLPLAVDPLGTPNLAAVRTTSPFAANATPKLLLTSLPSQGRAWLASWVRGFVGPLVATWRARHPRLQLVLVDGQANGHRRRARQLDVNLIAQRLRGFVDTLVAGQPGFAARRAAALADADLVYVPATRDIDTRLDILGAWAAGRPTIAAAGEAARGLVEDGRTARLIATEDPETLAAAVQEMCGAPELRALFVREASAHVRDHYVPRTAAERLVATYRDALELAHAA